MTTTAQAPPVRVTERIADGVLDGRGRQVRDRVRELVAAEVAPRAPAVDAGPEFPAAGYGALAEAGLAGLQVDPAYGGSGDTLVTYVTVVEEIARACGSTSSVYMTQMHACHPLMFAGTPEQCAWYMPAICRGTQIAAIAITELGAGSDMAGMATRARRTADGYVIDGVKSYIANGASAGVVVVFAVTDPGDRRQGVTAFLVDRASPGLSVGEPLPKLGQRGSELVQMTFTDCHVPAKARIGEEGSGYELSFRSVVRSRISAAAQGVGFAAGAVDGAVAWAAREGLLASGARYAQDIQFRLAELAAQTAAARMLLATTAALVDRVGTEAMAEVSAAKLFCTDTGMRVADAAMAVMGEDGDDPELAVERIWRDAKAAQTYDGTSEVQRMLVVRAIRHDQSSIQTTPQHERSHAI